MAYRCVAASAAGFIQQLAVCYIGRGYYFYTSGQIPAHKDPTKTDQKIIAQYGIEISKWARARRKKAGQANVHYLRFGTFYVIISTHGRHAFFEAEAKRLKDIRERPLWFAGYSIALRRGLGGGKWHPSVRIDVVQYKELKAHFEGIAVHRSVVCLSEEFRWLPFELYAPVRNQLYAILRAVNRKRKAAGFEPVPVGVLGGKRKSVRPFASPK